MWGRLLDIILYNSSGDSIYIVDHNNKYNNLICKGTIERPPYTEPTKLNLNIYNLAATVRAAIQLGEYSIIEIKFGYGDTNNTLSTIFKGNLMRVMYSRDDSVTSNTTFYCWDSGDFNSFGFYSGSFEDGVNYYQVASEICSNGEIKINSQISESLKNIVLSKTKSYFASQNEILQSIADATDTLYTVKDNTAYLIDKTSSGSENVVVFTKTIDSNKVVSNSGLLGIPTLSNDGLYFNCLINPNLGIWDLCEIDNSIISINQPGIIINREIGASLDPSGLYRVVNQVVTFSNDGDKAYIRNKALSKTLYDELI